MESKGKKSGKRGEAVSFRQSMELQGQEYKLTVGWMVGWLVGWLKRGERKKREEENGPFCRVKGRSHEEANSLMKNLNSYTIEKEGGGNFEGEKEQNSQQYV